MAFTCLLASPAGTVYKGDLWQVSVPGSEGRFSVRMGHIPIMATIIKGEVELALSENDRRKFMVASGLFEFRDNRARILVEECTAADV